MAPRFRAQAPSTVSAAYFRPRRHQTKAEYRESDDDQSDDDCGAEDAANKVEEQSPDREFAMHGCPKHKSLTVFEIIHPEYHQVVSRSAK